MSGHGMQGGSPYTVLPRVARTGTDPNSGATSHLLTIEIARRKNPISLERALAISQWDEQAAFVLNARSGRVALRTRAPSWMDEDGEPIPGSSCSVLADASTCVTQTCSKAHGM
jgi:hypothetical protein